MNHSLCTYKYHTDECFRTSKYSENCCPSTPPPVLASIVNPAFNKRVNTWMEFSLQYPFNGNRIICRPSNWFHATLVRPSSTAWFVSGNISSRTKRSADNIIRSPKSGDICSATISYVSIDCVRFWWFFMRDGFIGDVDVPSTFIAVVFPLRMTRSFFVCSNCLIIATNENKQNSIVLIWSFYFVWTWFYIIKILKIL